jgi:hypothetical protein
MVGFAVSALARRYIAQVAADELLAVVFEEIGRYLDGHHRA